MRHGSLEGAILNALWNLEKNNVYTNSVKDVYLILSKNENEFRAYTTIKTVMDRLVLKKVLLRFKQGNKFYYRTAYSCEEILEKSILDIAEKYCSGDINKLINVIESMKDKVLTLL